MPPVPPPDFTYVDLGDAAVALPDISEQPVIGLDTEFMREKTFFAELCLVQISTPEHIYCADPLVDQDRGVERDLATFWQILMDRCWVVHSGRQDMEVLFAASGHMPAAIFDTQVAAALLGHPPQIGYANLVTELFDVTLAKSHTRADWSIRPLSQSVIEYAAEDVEYLLPMYELMSEELAQLGRLEWAQQDSADLLNPDLYRSDPDSSVQRLKGARNMRGIARAAAVKLATWREQEALRRNRPRQWILRDTVLLELAVSRPKSSQELEHIAGLPPRTAQRSGDTFLRLLGEAEQDTSSYEPPARPDERQKAQLKAAQKLLAARAAELKLAPEILAPKKELSAAIHGDYNSRVFNGWRKQIVGEELQALFASGA
jgi:ribonuclease D